MAISHWQPARTRYAGQTDLTRLFTNLFDSSTLAPAAGAPRRFTPAADLVEHEGSYVLTADLPGLGEDDVTIEVKDRILTISGERAHEHEEHAAGYRRIERSFGSFRRTLTLPEGVEPQSITATFDKGVLEVTVPKPVAQQPQTVAITAGPKAEA